MSQGGELPAGDVDPGQPRAVFRTFLLSDIRGYSSFAAARGDSYTDFVARRVGNYQAAPLWGELVDQLWVR